MIKPFKWANSLTITMVLFYLIFWALGNFLPNIFNVLLNAQVLGADLASLYPAEVSFNTMLMNLVMVAITTWIFGLSWGLIYHRMTKVPPL